METTAYRLFLYCALFGLVQCRMLDLTHPLNTTIPRVPIFTRYTLTTRFNASYSNGAYWLLGNDISMAEHTGTHVDAPAHMYLGGMYIDQIPLDKLVSEAVVIDITDKAKTNKDATLDIKDVEAFEEKYGEIPQKALVIINTGGYKVFWDHKAYMGTPTPEISGTYHHPSFSPEVVKWLVEKRDINGIGVDRLSIDTGNSTEYPTHTMLFSYGRYGIENMNNVGLLPPKGAIVSVMPLPMQGGGGSPARVVAYLEGGEALLVVASRASVRVTHVDAVFICFIFVVLSMLCSQIHK